jgi:hypothetical protein
MNAPFNPKLPFASGAIDFELVPVDAARAAHDEPPPGVESLPTLVPDYWVPRRRRPGPSDRALTGATIDWLLSLPAAVRPKWLCEKYPRVANAIAAAAPGAERLAAIDALLLDRRGNRGGFPAEVRYEIEQLRDWTAAAVAPAQPAAAPGGG